MTGKHNITAQMNLELYQHQSFRGFLCQYAQRRRAENPRWSIGTWARSLGLKGTASLSMVLNGQRNPGPQMTAKFCDFFAFKPKDAQYFKDLVRLAKHKDSLSSLALTQMMQNTSHQKTERLLSAKEFSAMADWLFFAVRELTKVKGFREDPVWIRSRLILPASNSEILNALSVLKELKLLVYDNRGRLTSQDQIFSTSNDLINEAIATFHENALTLAKDRLRHEDVTRREYQSLTLAFHTKQMPEAKTLIRKFQDEFIALFEADAAADSIYQLNLQLLPLTKATKSSGVIK